MANEQDRDGLGDAEHPQDDSQEYISSRRFHIEKANARRAALITLLIIMCLQNLAVRLMNLPLYRVIEMRYCQQYYQTQDPDVIGGDGNIDEKLCKIDAIQVKLAWLQGAIETIHVVCDLLVTIPYAAIADLGYRALILRFNVLGLTLMYLWLFFVGSSGSWLPVEAMLLGPVLSLLGGGDCVLQAVAAAFVSEFSQNEVDKASWFAYMGSISYVTALMGPSLAALTMSWILWLPFWLGSGALVAAMMVTTYLPAQIRSHPPNSVESASLLNTDSYTTPRLSRSSNLYQEIASSMGQLAEALGSSAFRRLLLVFLMASFASSNSPILPQYISKRYGWSLSEAGYFLTIKAAINIVLLTVLVPTSITYLARKGLEGRVINRLGATMSLMISCLGAVCIGISWQTWQLLIAFVIYAIGSALPVFTMSMVGTSSTVTNHGDTGTQRYSIVMLTRTTGTVVGIPLMTMAWTKGIRAGGLAMGFPYFVSAAFYASAVYAIQLYFRKPVL